MAVQEISVQDALNRIKILKDRIEKAQTVGIVAAVINGMVGAETIDDWTKRAAANYQANAALIDNYRRLKAAIVQSNAVTRISVGRDTMTVAEAIERKTSIQMLVDFRDVLASNYASVIGGIERHNTKVSQQADQTATAVIGKKEASNVGEYEEHITAYMKRHGATLVNPMGAQQIISDLNDSIDEFRSAVDLA